MKKILRLIKRISAFIIAFLLIFLGYVAVSVHYWSVTDEGRLPPKTAVILYAINNNIITPDMKPPQFLTKPRPTTIAREDFFIPVNGGEIPARVYYPKKEGSHPIILYYHGGAFLEGYGNIDTHDNIIRALSARTQSVVISVGYRLAPQYIFPTAVEDSFVALEWAYKNGEKFNGDIDRIAVAGDSAGGNIATAVALMTRDLNGPELTAQALLYPLTTFQDIPLKSREIYDSGYYLLSRAVMYHARDKYTPLEEMWESPYTSPLNAESLADLPATLIITAQFDPLKDEGELYGKRLANDGVPVKYLHYLGVMHGFVSFYEVMQVGEHGLRQTVTFLKDVFNGEFTVGEEFETEVVYRQRGKEGIREYIEAYAIAAFLIIQDLRN